MIQDDPGGLARMRISDADRDSAASVLSEALAEGRLTADEHSERLDAIYAAKTQADLQPLISDLPGAAGAPAALAQRRPATGPVRMVAVFSETSKGGLWRVPQALTAVSVFGHTQLDLREATLAGREVSIRAICVFGNVEITVPPEMHVVDTGWALFGGREMPPDIAESARPDAPVLRISGVSIFGLATVRRKARRPRLRKSLEG